MKYLFIFFDLYVWLFSFMYVFFEFLFVNVLVFVISSFIIFILSFWIMWYSESFIVIFAWFICFFDIVFKLSIFWLFVCDICKFWFVCEDEFELWFLIFIGRLGLLLRDFIGVFFCEFEFVWWIGFMLGLERLDLFSCRDFGLRIVWFRIFVLVLFIIFMNCLYLSINNRLRFFFSNFG